MALIRHAHTAMLIKQRAKNSIFGGKIRAEIRINSWRERLDREFKHI